jgi:hypothetical protein
MTSKEAATVAKGDVVMFKGQVYMVHSIKTTGMAAPYFRLSDGLTSYSLCSLAPDMIDPRHR